MVSVSRKPGTGLLGSIPNFSVAEAIPEPMLNVARPPDNSSSAPISIAIIVGWRLNGLNTPALIAIRCVAIAQAAAAGKVPRANAFSANQNSCKFSRLSRSGEFDALGGGYAAMQAKADVR